jgi:hypothetical protein
LHLAPASTMLAASSTRQEARIRNYPIRESQFDSIRSDTALVFDGFEVAKTSLQTRREEEHVGE